MPLRIIKIFLYSYLIILLFSIKSFAKQSPFLKLIPAGTSAYLNIKDLKNISELPFAGNSQALIFFNDKYGLIGQVDESGIYAIYTSSLNILKPPLLLGKTGNPSIFLDKLNKIIKLEKNSFDRFKIYKLVSNNPSSKNTFNLYFSLIDNYFVFGSLTDIKLIINTYLGKSINFADSEISKEVEKIIIEQKPSLKFYINVEGLNHVYEPILKQAFNIVIQSILVKGGGYSDKEIKDISKANIEQIFSYIAQVKYITIDYDKTNKKARVWIKFITGTPLCNLTGIPPEQMKDFSLLPEKNVAIAFNILEGSKTRQNHYNYMFEKMLRFDSSYGLQKNSLARASSDLESFGNHEIWAWINSPEGLVWTDIVEFKGKDLSNPLQKRFSGLNIFYNPEQKPEIKQGKNFEYKKVQIKSEIINFTPFNTNILELSGYTGKIPYSTIWYCYIKNNLIMTIEEEPVVIKEIIATAIKEKKSLLQKINNPAINSKNNNILFFSPELISLYLNSATVEQNKNNSDTSFTGQIVKNIPLLNDILSFPDSIVTGLAKNEGFYFEIFKINPGQDQEVKKNKNM
ncbi:hypothetical protein HY745_07880 [Candidatus Desantisbacteria bacterium]|nr:hypothetical protein [Candidatus Desantisbacteria bacterium]